jgi:hypothetical protein
MKKGDGSGVGSGSGSISKRYGSGDPDPHQNVTDPQTVLGGIKHASCNVHLFAYKQHV